MTSDPNFNATAVSLPNTTNLMMTDIEDYLPVCFYNC